MILSLPAGLPWIVSHPCTQLYRIATVSVLSSPAQLTNTKPRDGRNNSFGHLLSFYFLPFFLLLIHTKRERHYFCHVAYSVTEEQTSLRQMGWCRLHSTLEFSALNPSDWLLRNVKYLFFHLNLDFKPTALLKQSTTLHVLDNILVIQNMM